MKKDSPAIEKKEEASEQKPKEPTAEADTKAHSSIFGSKTDSSSLFAQKPASSSLFAKKPEVPEKKTESKPEPEEAPKKSLFGLKPTKGLFNKPGSLFGSSTQTSLSNKSSTMFGKPQSGSGVFKSGSMFNKDAKFGSSDSKPLFASTPEEEKKEEKTVEARSKDDNERIFSKEISKFQQRTGSKGVGLLSLEKSGENSKTKFLLITFRNSVGKTLFTGTVLESSKLYDVTSKPGKFLIKIGCMVQDKDNKPKAEVVQVTFHKDEEKSEFKAKWEEAKPSK